MYLPFQVKEDKNNVWYHTLYRGRVTVTLSPSRSATCNCQWALTISFLTICVVEALTNWGSLVLQTRPASRINVSYAHQVCQQLLFFIGRLLLKYVYQWTERVCVCDTFAPVHKNKIKKTTKSCFLVIQVW